MINFYIQNVEEYSIKTVIPREKVAKRLPEMPIEKNESSCNHNDTGFDVQTFLIHMAWPKQLIKMVSSLALKMTETVKITCYSDWDHFSKWLSGYFGSQNHS